MDEKGYVVCLLKYMMGTETGDSESWNRQSGNAKPICFGYFGRADVVPVRRFKDYMRIASENDAEFIGSRKQLLMYSLSEELSGQIKLYDPNSAPEEKNCLPFRPAEGDSRPALCCLSVLKIDNDVKNRLGTNWLAKSFPVLPPEIGLLNVLNKNQYKESASGFDSSAYAL